MAVVAVVFVLYLVLVLVVGVVASRYGKTMEGYFLADRGLGAWVTAISSVASSESGWLVIGLVGEAYMWGAKAVWTVPGCLLGYVCNWYIVAPRLRQHAERVGAITIPDLLEERLGDTRHLLRAIGILVILFALMFYVSAQFTATGKAFQKAFGAPFGVTYAHGVLLGGLITIVYTLLGGFRAVSWTDLVQGLLMVLGLVVLPIVTVASVGGFGKLVGKLESVPPRAEAVFSVQRGAGIEIVGVENEVVEVVPGVAVRRLGTDDGFAWVAESSGDVGALVDGRPLSAGSHELRSGSVIRSGDVEATLEKIVHMLGGEALADVRGGMTGPALLGWIIGLLGIGLGYPGQPHILARYVAAKSKEALRRGRLIAIVWGILAMYGAVVLGLAARIAVPGLVDPEQAYPHLAMTLLPPVLGGVLLAAIISAMMSTADSQLLVVSSAVARDLIEKIVLRRSAGSRERLERIGRLVPRLAVLAVGLLALVLALGRVRAVFWFVLFAWSGLGAAFGPPILLSLFWKRLTVAGAAAGMIVGLGTTIAWKMWLKGVFEAATGLSLYELVPAFALSMLATWVVSLVTKAPEVPKGLEGLTE